MPRMPASRRWCVCKHHRSNHRFEARGLGHCYATGCSCRLFVSRLEERQRRAAAQFHAALQATRAHYGLT